VGLDANCAQIKSWSSEALLADHSALLSVILHLLTWACPQRRPTYIPQDLLRLNRLSRGTAQST
jgi:hypothetical protein